MTFQNKIFSLFLLLFICQQHTIVGQQDNKVSLPIQLTITPKASVHLAGENIRFSFSPTTGAEQILTPTSVGKLWLNYSSIVDGFSTNTICVSLNTTNLPSEIMIKLVIGADVGAGAGQIGKPTEPIILNNSPQAIITNIGSCYTGVGAKKGHPLTYTWELAPNYDPDILKISELNIQAGVVYTIVNNE